MRDTLFRQPVVFVMNDGNGLSAFTPVDDGPGDGRDQRVQHQNHLRAVEKPRPKRVCVRPGMPQQSHDFANLALRAGKTQSVDHAKERVDGRLGAHQVVERLQKSIPPFAPERMPALAVQGDGHALSLPVPIHSYTCRVNDLSDEQVNHFADGKKGLVG
ncbi:hypothetical protein [Streptosporangium sp. 'caverna']|uniref:hypothetical protein n=1 Tax=Streptosporangium sp. 'caverna' TaxID=2202249 RepID=UPI0013A7032C|nr:hypothetical protein [Streptosporangium sp. 'caverna']